MRLVLGLEYSGSAFCGWQTQPNGCGVQDALETALSEIAGERISTICAGRTDAGVHALGQVIHFDTVSSRPLNAWVRGVNSVLNPVVSVLWVKEVGEDFHARYCAQARRYLYLLLNRAQRPGLLHTRAGWFHLPLDESLMQSGARALVGEHDFSAFRAAECQAKSPVRIVKNLSIRRNGELIVFDIAANAFLHHMVRNIIGALIYVGCGRQRPEWISELMSSRDRTRAAPTFSPDGLYLYEVEYPPRWNLPCHAKTSAATLLATLN